MSSGLWKQQLSSLIKDFTQPIGMPLLRFIWSWTKRMVPLLAIFSLVAVWYVFFREWRDRRVDFLIGPQGGTGAEQAFLVERQVRKEWSLFGPNYAVTRVYTDGFQENHRRVNADLKGNVFGFAMDGLRDNDTMNVQTILPLDWCYLHFIVRKDLLSDLGLDDPPVDGVLTPVSFSQLSKRLLEEKKKLPHDRSAKWPIKLYLGPQSSGTRSIIGPILDCCNIKLEDIAATGISDFDEMHAALKQGTVHGGFCIAPLKSALITKIAKESACTLIAIDRSAELAKAIPYLESGTIHAYAYQFGDEDFPLGPVQTVAVRRVLVASPYMNPSDAYRLASHVRTALHRFVPERDANGRLPGPDGALAKGELGYDLHPGALMRPDQAPVSSWYERHWFWIGPLMLAMVISLVSELRAKLVQWLSNHGKSGEPPDESISGGHPLVPQPGNNVVSELLSVETNDHRGHLVPAAIQMKQLPAAAPEPAYAQIEGRVKRLLREMRRADDTMFATGHAPSKKALCSWEERIAAIGRAISSARRQGKLTHNVDTLKQYVVELRLKHQFLRQPLFRPEGVRKQVGGSKSGRAAANRKPR